MASKYCNICNHKCHCIGKGYLIQSNQCGICICDKCDCGSIILGAPTEKKSWFQKFINWWAGIYD